MSDASVNEENGELEADNDDDEEEEE
nr:prothymosin alpha homolog - Escherichia coli (fragments) [Escherichia coli]